MLMTMNGSDAPETFYQRGATTRFLNTKATKGDAEMSKY